MIQSKLTIQINYRVDISKEEWEEILKYINFNPSDEKPREFNIKGKAFVSEIQYPTMGEDFSETKITVEAKSLVLE